MTDEHADNACSKCGAYLFDWDKKQPFCSDCMAEARENRAALLRMNSRLENERDALKRAASRRICTCINSTNPCLKCLIEGNRIEKEAGK